MFDISLLLLAFIFEIFAFLDRQMSSPLSSLVPISHKTALSQNPPLLRRELVTAVNSTRETLPPSTSALYNTTSRFISRRHRGRKSFSKRCKPCPLEVPYIQQFARAFPARCAVQSIRSTSSKPAIKHLQQKKSVWRGCAPCRSVNSSNSNY